MMADLMREKEKSYKDVSQIEKQFEGQLEKVRTSTFKIQNKIGIMSGKGGVGKSTVTALLALGFAVEGNRVGILDADINGPSIPTLFGVRDQTLEENQQHAEPVVGPYGIRIVSTELLLKNKENPIMWKGPMENDSVWRGSMEASVIREFLGDSNWGDLDLLLVDLPPGNTPITMMITQLLPDLTGMVVVTTPNHMAKSVVRKSITFAERMNIPIIGCIENMSGFHCPGCEKVVPLFAEPVSVDSKLNTDLNIPLIGSIPFKPEFFFNNAHVTENLISSNKKILEPILANIKIAIKYKKLIKEKL